MAPSLVIVTSPISSTNICENKAWIQRHRGVGCVCVATHQVHMVVNRQMHNCDMETNLVQPHRAE